MEILAVELKSGVVGNPMSFIDNSTPGWRKLASHDGWSSLKLLKTGFPGLRGDPFVVVVEGCVQDSEAGGLTEFCEVFYNLDCGQWFVWPSPSAATS
jgi:hypothetical protein